MVVLIANITDAPGRRPVQVDIYGKTLDPGAQIKIPAELIDSKVKSLESSGLIAIGSLPSWYESTKKRKGKALSKEQMNQRIVMPKREIPKELPKDDKKKG